MKVWVLVFGVLSGVSGWSAARPLFDTQGFETPLYIPGTLCKEGAPEELVSWELDVEATDPFRNPKSDFVFYVDDLSIETVNPLPDRELKGGMK